MTIRLRTAFFMGLVVILAWFLYIVRGILTPFVLAAMFAYIFNPLVNFCYHKIKLPRTITIVFIYVIVMGLVVGGAILITHQIGDESAEFRNSAQMLLKTANDQLATLPDWAQPTVRDWLLSFSQTRIIPSRSLTTIFPRAILEIIDSLIFLFSAFYFLKEGGNIFRKLLHFVPHDYQNDIELLIRKMNSVLSAYLRGELILVLIVSCMLFIALSILGVHFALIVAVVSGFAEIVPWVGPFVAGFIACLIVFFTGTNFNIPAVQAVIVVALIYFVARMLEDYFIMPLVMGRIVRLHPLLILFVAVAGEHIAGLLGLILAVPIAACLRILFEYMVEKVSPHSSKPSLQ